MTAPVVRALGRIGRRFIGEYGSKQSRAKESKRSPHQGKKEAARRLKRMANKEAE